MTGVPTLERIQADRFIDAVLAHQDAIGKLVERQSEFVHPDNDEGEVDYLPSEAEYRSLVAATALLDQALAATDWTAKLWNR